MNDNLFPASSAKIPNFWCAIPPVFGIRIRMSILPDEIRNERQLKKCLSRLDKIPYIDKKSDITFSSIFSGVAIKASKSSSEMYWLIYNLILPPLDINFAKPYDNTFRLAELKKPSPISKRLLLTKALLKNSIGEFPVPEE